MTNYMTNVINVAQHGGKSRHLSHTAWVSSLALPFNSCRSLNKILLNFVFQFHVTGTARKMKTLTIHVHKVIGRHKLVNAKYNNILHKVQYK